MKNLLNLSNCSYRLTPAQGEKTIAIFRSGQKITKFVDTPVDLSLSGSGVEFRTPYSLHRLDEMCHAVSYGGGRASALCIRDRYCNPVVTLFRLADNCDADAEALVEEMNAAGTKEFYFEVE